MITASTKSLPATSTIANAGFTRDGDTVIYKADILVPYTFVRLFIGIKQEEKVGFSLPVHGWPIDKIGVDDLGTQWHQVVN